MTHDRKFVCGDVDLVPGRIRNLKETLFVQAAIEKIIIDGGFMENAPFTFVSLMYRHGFKNMVKSEFHRISKKYNDLPLAVEIKKEILLWADKNNIKLLQDVFMIATLEVLIHAGEKYKLPTELLHAERAKYGDIPETIEEAEAYGNNIHR